MQLDTIIRHARIHTMADAAPEAVAGDATAAAAGDAPPAPEAVGIAGGQIVAFDDELEGSYASAGEVIDAAELTGTAMPTVVPGFIDAHCHTTWFGLTLASVDVESCPGGIAEVYERLERAAAQLPDGEWVQATGYSHHDYAGSYPDIAVLDRITGGRPLFMRQVSGHSAIVNTAALTAAGMLEPGYTDPPGGKVVRDASGRPTGLVEETAQTQVQDLIRPYSVETIVHALDLATAHYAKEGITSFGEAGIAAGWIGHSPLEVFAYQQARRAGLLRARAQLMPVIDAVHPIAGHAADTPELGLDLGMVTGFGDDEIRIGPVKIFMDGALSGRTAALSENYVGADDAGYLQDDPEVLRAQTLAAYLSGWSLAVHAIGDAAVDAASPTSLLPSMPADRRPSPTGSSTPGWCAPNSSRCWPSTASRSPRRRRSSTTSAMGCSRRSASTAPICSTAATPSSTPVCCWPAAPTGRALTAMCCAACTPS